MNQNRSLVGTAIFAALLILTISGAALLLREWRSRQGQIGHREPLPFIGYCSPEQVRPCIQSFALDPDGTLVIQIQTENFSSPQFNVKIRHGESEKLYVCRRASGFSTDMICTGEFIPAGDPVQFLLLSKKDNRLLAEGTFPIIGLAIATPELATTPTFVPARDRPPK